MRDRAEKKVTLVQVSKEDARLASTHIEEICESYGVSPVDKDRLWAAFACFCTYLVIGAQSGPTPWDKSARKMDPP